MGVELDWLEREERYRRRVLRLLVASVVLVGAAILTVAFLRGRENQTRLRAEAERQVAERERQAEQRRAQFVADSTAAADRLAEFMRVHGAVPMADVPIFIVPLPPGVGAQALAQRVFTEYARVANPTVTAATESDWYRLYYVDLMNGGPLRGRAILLPAMRQNGTRLEFVKPSFSDITRAQIEVGMRDMPVEAGLDSAALMMQQPVETPAAETPPATTAAPPAPVQQPPAQSPAPARQPEPQPEPAPAPEPQETPIELDPVVEPIVEPEPAAPQPDEPKAAPPDSVPPPRR